MRWQLLSRLLGVALSLSVGGCSSDGAAAILVELRTDFVAGVEFASVRTSLENPSQSQERSAVRGEDFTEGTRVAELSGVPLGARVLVLRLVDIDGREVAVRRARITLAGDMGVVLAITRSCAAVLCGAAETCSGGTCVADTCIEGLSADSCEPECVQASDCAAMAACAEPRCTTGLCLYGQGAGACGAEEYCDVAVGCTPVTTTDAGPGPDAGAPDTGLSDSGTLDARADTGAPDAGSDAGTVFVCGAPPGPGTVALYRMETFSRGQLTDATGRHHGGLPAGAPDLVTGPMACGSAYGGRPLIHGVVPASPAFRLAEGSFDFRWRPAPAETNATGLVSRDASGSDLAGHVTVYQAGTTGRLVARIQNLTSESHRCSDAPVTVGVWHHVGVNFGPGGFELFLDGVEQRGTGDWRFDSVLSMQPCELDAVTYGVDGNDNPWVIGASAANSSEGTADDVRSPQLGDLDEVRFSSVRRDFTAVAP